jgi:hypothetical protein
MFSQTRGEKMNTSETISKLAVALAAFQAEVPAIKKDGENPHYRSKYATLDTIMDTVRPVLTKHGLAILQSQNATRLLHTSGEWVQVAVDLAPESGTPQAYGSAMTYARRYGVSAILGLSTEEDDDGNAATTPKQAPVSRPAPRPQAPSGPAGQPITPTNKIGFGKYAASTWLEVPTEYLTWLIANGKSKPVIDVATAELNHRKAVAGDSYHVDLPMGF